MCERRGKYFKLFSMMVNGIKYYFIGSVNTLGYKWVYSSSEDAVEMFENAERNAEKYGVAE